MSNTFSRRHFLQYGMAAIAGGTALGSLPVHAAQAPAGTAAPKSDLVKGYCPFCQVRCTYHARVRNGKILELIGDRGNRWTGGAMCPKGLSIVELLNSPYRLVQPMLKQGSEWKTISYAEAVDIVVDKLRQSRAKHGDKNRRAPCPHLPPVGLPRKRTRRAHDHAYGGRGQRHARR